MDKLNEILLSDDIKSNLDELFRLIPELKDMVGFLHNHPEHHLDVWEHTLLALSLSPKKLEVRIALLLHDIGKPHSYQEDGSIRHFKNHPVVSAQMAYNILSRLGYPDDFINYICKLVMNHDNKLEITDEKEDYYQDLFSIQCCDALAHNPNKLSKRKDYLLSLLSYLEAKNIQVDGEVKKLIK